jgi:hypothetical protein
MKNQRVGGGRAFRVAPGRKPKLVVASCHEPAGKRKSKRCPGKKSLSYGSGLAIMAQFQTTNQSDEKA